MSTPVYVGGNHLLDSLSLVEKLRVYPQLEAIRLPLALAVYDSGLAQKYAYFPVGAVISLQCMMTNGDVGETAAIGNEGMVGTSIVMGADSTTDRAVVKRAGLGFRLKAQVIKQEFYRGGPLMQLLLRYTQSLITQTAQTVACNRYHSIDQQVCRALLVSLDQTQSNEVLMTQELIAKILGIRREGVTESAMSLQKAGLIRYARGRISILDRRGLENRSCECYAVMKRECTRLLSSEYPAPATPGRGNI